MCDLLSRGKVAGEEQPFKIGQAHTFIASVKAKFEEDPDKYRTFLAVRACPPVQLEPVQGSRKAGRQQGRHHLLCRTGCLECLCRMCACARIEMWDEARGP